MQPGNQNLEAYEIVPGSSAPVAGAVLDAADEPEDDAPAAAAFAAPEFAAGTGSAGAFVLSTT